MITREAALAVLREYYVVRVESLAEELRAWNVAGLLCDALLEEANRFEALCRAKACSTVEDARIVLALAEHWEEAGDDWYDVRNQAALAIALDAAHLAGAEWFVGLHIAPSERPA